MLQNAPWKDRDEGVAPLEGSDQRLQCKNDTGYHRRISMDEDNASFKKHGSKKLAECLGAEQAEQNRNVPVMLDQIILHVFDLNRWHHWILVFAYCFEQPDTSRELVLYSSLFLLQILHSDLVKFTTILLFAMVQFVAPNGLNQELY